jgi:DNA-binding response OmpR family regulator
MLLTSLSSRMAETAVSMTQAMTTEAEDYLEKPASPEELFQRVEKLLRKQPRKGR